MASSHQHRIRIATDGSASALAALATALRFPWPASSTARVVTARYPWLRRESQKAQSSLARSIDLAASEAEKRLARRWRDVSVAISEEPPAEAILSEADRFNATTVVVGWRGHGTFRRLLAGSVSRTVAAAAKCPVLVARMAPPAVHRIVLAYDGSANAERAVDLLMSLEPRRRSRVMVMKVVELVVLPASAGRFPAALRAELQQSVSEANNEAWRAAEEAGASVAARLQSVGWSAKAAAPLGAPVATLLDGLIQYRADLLIMGASSGSAIERALLGSAARALMDRSPIPVLLVR